MHSQLHDLNGRHVARLDVGILGHGNLRHANGSRVRIPRGTPELPDGLHDVAHVGRTIVGAVSAESHVDVNEGRLVTLEPAWLEGYSSAGRWPVCPVARGTEAAACGGGGWLVSSLAVSVEDRSRREAYKDTSTACQRETSRW